MIDPRIYSAMVHLRNLSADFKAEYEAQYALAHPDGPNNDLHALYKADKNHPRVVAYARYEALLHQTFGITRAIQALCPHPTVEPFDGRSAEYKRDNPHAARCTECSEVSHYGFPGRQDG